jgi:hypothetical protein
LTFEPRDRLLDLFFGLGDPSRPSIYRRGGSLQFGANLRRQLALELPVVIQRRANALAGVEHPCPNILGAGNHILFWREDSTAIALRKVYGLAILPAAIVALRRGNLNRAKSPAGALLLSRNRQSSPNGARADPGAHLCRTGSRPVRRTRRGSEAPDDWRQGSGRQKAIGERDVATRGSAQLRRVGPHVIPMGARVLTDVKGAR